MAVRKNYSVTSKTGLNVREKPSKDSKILAVLPHEAKVTVDPNVEAPYEWAAVKGGGFVMRKYLK